MRIIFIVTIFLLAPLLFTCSKKVTNIEPAPLTTSSASPSAKPAEVNAPELSPPATSGTTPTEAPTAKTKDESKIEPELEMLKNKIGTIERMRTTVPASPAAPPVNADKKHKSKKFVFDNADAIGYLDNPTPVYTLDLDDAKTPADSKKHASPLSGTAAASVKAASHDDNEEIVSYREYCTGINTKGMPYPWDVSERYIIKCAYSDSSTGWDHAIAVSDKAGKTIFSARTPASGEIVLLPKIDIGKTCGSIDQYRVSVDNGVPTQIVKGNDDLLQIPLAGSRQQPDTLSLQICFLMDATGSMSDEIAQLQDVIFSIHSRIGSLPSRPSVQFSIVEYRDKNDAFVVRGHQFTGDIDRFQMTLEKVSAAGGGDTPEDIESALAWCLDSLVWKQNALKFAFLIGDAPPHVEMKKSRNYLTEAMECRNRAIMVCPVGASGLDLTGEYVFRQIALITRGQFVFLHYGEKGESDGVATAADPGKVSHHTGSNYNARRLDDIVVDIVSGELGYLTPATKIVRSYPEPKEQEELLDLRLDNLLRQVVATGLPLSGKALILPPFSVSDSSLGELAEYCWEAAIEDLPKCTGASIIERQRLSDLCKEKALSLSGLTEDKPAADVGKMLNADFMLLSRIHFLGSIRLCHMRLVDCTTGEVVRAARVRL